MLDIDYQLVMVMDHALYTYIVIQVQSWTENINHPTHLKPIIKDLNDSNLTPSTQ